MTGTGPEALEISGEALAAIRAAAAAAWPEECCGVLVGRREGARAVVVRTVAAVNVATERRHRFEVDPRALFDAHRGARAAGEEVLGPYHSHPEGTARPSATDAARAVAPGECWLIVATADGRAGENRAFAFDGRTFGEIALRVVG